MWLNVAQAVIVRGLKETQHALNVAGLKFHVLKVEALRKFGQKVREVAKENTPVDTGALRASIYEQLLLESIIETIELIGVGKEGVTRGAGNFKFSSKTGEIVNRQVPTSDYAEAVHTQKPYMLMAFHWAETYIDKTIRSLLNASLRGL